VSDPDKDERRRKKPAGSKKLHQAADGDGSGEPWTGQEDAAAERSHGLSPTLQGHIGRQLRAVFDEVAREPVPERFLQLLKDLEQSGDK
jgi:hypothetical protein